MSGQIGVLEAFVGAVGEVLGEEWGTLLARLTALQSPGDVSLGVESTHKWPAAGSAIVDEEALTYSGKTSTSLTGVNGGAGLDAGHRELAVAYYSGKDQTRMDDLRGSFLVGRAVGDQLTTIGRNLAVPRPIGIQDGQYRLLIRAVGYQARGMIGQLETVLEALYPGVWSVYEDPIRYPCTVFISIPAAQTTSSAGKAFPEGDESVTSSTVTTLTVAKAPITVTGVWLATDPDRVGTNYWDESVIGSLGGVNAQRLSVAAAPFTAADIGRAVRVVDSVDPLINGAYVVDTFISATDVGLREQRFNNGLITGGAGNVFRTTEPMFESGDVGKTIRVTGSLGTQNDGYYTVQSVTNPTEVVVAGAPGLIDEAGLTWGWFPAFPTPVAEAGRTVVLSARGTVAGKGLTLPTALPGANTPVLVDYTSVLSAELLPNESVVGDPPGWHGFYLFDQFGLLKDIADMITVAGVIPEFGVTQ